MNVHTFKDVVKSKRSSLANDLDDDGDDDDAALMEGKVDGEEEEGDDKVHMKTFVHNNLLDAFCVQYCIFMFTYMRSSV